MEALNKAEMISKLKEKLRKDLDSVYKFNSSSTLRVTLAYTTDTGRPVKIVGIHSVSSVVACINDDDNDGILNAADSVPGKFGEFSANGAPDYDLDGTPDADDRCRGTYGSAQNKGCPESYFVTNKQFEAGIGPESNDPKIGLPDLNQLAYQDASGADANSIGKVYSYRKIILDVHNYLSLPDGRHRKPLSAHCFRYRAANQIGRSQSRRPAAFVAYGL